jgi:hypothetical protein
MDGRKQILFQVKDLKDAEDYKRTLCYHGG